MDTSEGRILTRVVMSSAVTAAVSLGSPGIQAAGAQEVAAGEVAPPRANVMPTQLVEHGDVRVDEYFWLREREDPEVIAYLEAENAYTKAMMAHTEALQERLFEEIKGRIKQTDYTVPFEEDGYFYYYRTEDEKEYRIYSRKMGSLEAPEEILVDVNEVAESHGYTWVPWPEINSAGNVMAFATDTAGRRFYTIRFKDLDSGEMLPDVISDVTSNYSWANDGRTFFYTKQDPETLRWDRIYRHVLGTDPADDELAFEEKDVEFNAAVWRTKSKRYVMIGSFQTLSTEMWYLDADAPAGEFTVILPREPDHEYEAEHFGDYFYIRSNDGAQNFKLMRTPVASTGKEHWEEVIGHREDVLIESLELFRDHMVVVERKDGLLQMRVRPWSGQGEHYLDFGEPTYLAYVDRNRNIDSHVLRFGYESMTTPESVYDYDMRTREKVLLKRQEVLGGFDPADYVSERLFAPARDGARVPVSIVYRKGTKKDGSNPLLLYGYGSYGFSRDATFSSSRLSLLDRGFAYAIAHIRGGQELGRGWYEDGKLLKKKNTFTDFIDVAEHLIAENYTNPEVLFAQGGSAGGLLMGAVMNMRPDLFKGIIAHVPWVDVVTTMLDESIPLTTSEYDEWGDPNQEEYYHYMLSYSPYDNVVAQDYPNVLVTTGLHDSQVQYWEPAKWVAKLRAMKTDDNRLLLKTNMEAGHGGASGRYKRYREIALDYAFLLDLAGYHGAPVIGTGSR